MTHLAQALLLTTCCGVVLLMLLARRRGRRAKQKRDERIAVDAIFAAVNGESNETAAAAEIEALWKSGRFLSLCDLSAIEARHDVGVFIRLAAVCVGSRAMR